MAFSVPAYDGTTRSIEGVDPIAARLALINDMLSAEVSAAPVVTGPDDGEITILPNAPASIIAALAFVTTTGAAATPCLLKADGTDLHISDDGLGVEWDSDQTLNTVLVLYRSLASVELAQLLRPYPQS